MMLGAGLLLGTVSACAGGAARAERTAHDLPRVVFERDDQSIESSCELLFPSTPIEDRDGDGLVFVRGKGLRVVCSGVLDGNPGGLAPDELRGIGMVVQGSDCRIEGFRATGLKLGLWLRGADRTLVEDASFDGLHRQRLRSTPEHCDDGADWLAPHENDQNQWVELYGAAVYAEDVRDLELRGLRVRNAQNGILFDRVSDSRVLGCDASFLSGWGLGLWRSSGNTVARSAFDFCVRGYSHGKYNRGQDSAGLLLFEQCHENLFLENSATHGGDGLFAFAGREALGEEPAPRADFDYARAGHRDNVFRGNDFSDAAAHGFELTFAGRNWILENRFARNAICGLWGGYSRELCIEGNLFEENGEGAYGTERGGINIEHGRANRIAHNRFSRNACGVRLWWDDDAALANTAWARANGVESRDNAVFSNHFAGDAIGIELESSGPDRASFEENTFDSVPLPVARRDTRSAPDAPRGAYAQASSAPEWVLARSAQARLDEFPVVFGARPELAGREHIRMTEWGPWDGASPLVQLVHGGRGVARWRVLGAGELESFLAHGEPAGEVPALEVLPLPVGEQREFELRLLQPGTALPYRVSAQIAGRRAEARGVLVDASWSVRCFATPFDPREDREAFARAAAAAPAVQLDDLRLSFGAGGPSQLAQAPAPWRAAELPRDHFGTRAQTRLALPAGEWALRLSSDDGVRVTLDGEVLFEDWTWHAPRSQRIALSLQQARTVELLVEHFELDGHAELLLQLEAP